jgi:hypothetical protein
MNESASKSRQALHRSRRMGRLDGRPHAGTAAVSQRGAVRSQDPGGKTVPITGGGWQKALPDARWRAGIRRTEGGAQRQLQARPLHCRDDRHSSVAEGEDPRSKGVDQDASKPAMNSKGSRGESVSPAERMSLHRRRRRNGLRCIRILLHETEIDSLIEKGFLTPEHRHDRGAVRGRN